MRVIFLDIDGVLNSDSTPNPRKFPYIVDDRLLVRFRELVSRTGATVVLSSTWRVDPVGRLAAKFYEVPFHDICPDVPNAPRCEEMQSWLGQHPEVTRYAVLDDDDDCLDELPLFQPSSRTGLTEEIACGIEEYLAGRSDKDMRASAIARLGQNLHALFGREKSQGTRNEKPGTMPGLTQYFDTGQLLTQAQSPDLICIILLTRRGSRDISREARACPLLLVVPQATLPFLSARSAGTLPRHRGPSACRYGRAPNLKPRP